MDKLKLSFFKKKKCNLTFSKQNKIPSWAQNFSTRKVKTGRVHLELRSEFKASLSYRVKSCFKNKVRKTYKYYNLSQWYTTGQAPQWVQEQH